MTPQNKDVANNNRLTRTIGIVLFFFSLFLFLSFISYVFYFRADQSIAIDSWNNIKDLDNYKINNWLNKIGIFFGYFFIERLFGLFAFLVPIWIFMLSINFYLKKIFFKTGKHLKKFILYIFLGSSFLSFVASFILKTNFPLGGSFGDYLSAKDFFIHNQIGVVGIILLWITILMIANVFLLDTPLNIFRYFNKEKNSEDKNIKVEAQSNEEQTGFKDFMDDTLFEKDNITFDIDESTNNKKTSKEEPIALDLELEIEEPKISDNNIEEISFEINTDQSSNIEKENQTSEIETGSNDTYNSDYIESLPNYDPKADLSNYKFPSVELLNQYTNNKPNIDKQQLELNKNQIIKTLNDFGITITSIKATVGPTVTLYEITPAAGNRISKIKNLEDDIALALSALGIRIIAPIPGKGTIGIEVPNVNKQIVSMKSVIENEKFQNSSFELPLALGKNISNEVIVADLTKMPHLLMAGATGKGKSVGINAILISLLYKKHPSELKFVLVDPKKVELSIYSTIEKHFLAKLPFEEEAIITDVKKVVNTLNSLCIEMDNRYDLLKKAQVRTIKEYNHKFINRQLNPINGHNFLPYIVLIIDEFADLIMTAGKEVEQPIARLAQLARAIGIHLIVATQRPSVNVITGIIKANFPARISFATSSLVDSKTILDTKGAEQLIGQGDMLYALGSDISRLQCAFIDTPEVDKICSFIQSQQGYSSAFELPEYFGEEEGPKVSFDKKDLDDLFIDSAREIVISQMGSISLIQRKLSIGHNRAGRIIDQLEAFGVVGPNRGSKPREVYFKSLDELERHLETIK